MRDFLVGGALIIRDGQLLLVRNRRRGGHIEWSTPGGVIDPGETMLEGLGREVTEETGLRVLEWAHKSYEVRAIAPGLGWRLRVEVHLAEHVEGELHVDDPDGIVEHAEWSDVPAVGDRMAATAPWVGEPLLAWLQDRGPEIGTFLYAVTGEDRESMTVERVERLP